MQCDESKQLMTLGRLATKAGMKRGTLHAWIVRGLAIQNGKTIKLRAERQGWRYMSCRRWLSEFLSAYESARDSVRTPVVRRREYEANRVEIERQAARAAGLV